MTYIEIKIYYWQYIARNRNLKYHPSSLYKNNILFYTKEYIQIMIIILNYLSTIFTVIVDVVIPVYCGKIQYRRN